jgi:hypothetical protein
VFFLIYLLRDLLMCIWCLRCELVCYDVLWRWALVNDLKIMIMHCYANRFYPVYFEVVQRLQLVMKWFWEQQYIRLKHRMLEGMCAPDFFIDNWWFTVFYLCVKMSITCIPDLSEDVPHHCHQFRRPLISIKVFALVVFWHCHMILLLCKVPWECNSPFHKTIPTNNMLIFYCLSHCIVNGVSWDRWNWYTWQPQ